MRLCRKTQLRHGLIVVFGDYIAINSFVGLIFAYYDGR